MHLVKLGELEPSPKCKATFGYEKSTNVGAINKVDGSSAIVK